MDNDQKFWVSIWAIVATFILAMSIALSAFNANQDALLHEMVKKGADPIIAACALKGPSGASAAPICILAVKK